MNTVLFYIIIFLTNVIQGITGFAGTILAMPPSLILVGYDVAKPILNVLGILAGVYVFVTQWKHVDWKQLKKVVIVMAIGIFGGFFLKNALAGYDAVLYKFLQYMGFTTYMGKGSVIQKKNHHGNQCCYLLVRE